MLGLSAGYSAQKGKHLTDTLTFGSNLWNGNWNGNSSYLSKLNTMNVGLLYLLGFDYWITNDIYVGLEYGVNLNFQYSSAQEQTLLKISNNKVTSETVKIHQPYKNFNLGNFTSPYIRLGWRFYKSPRSGG